MDPKTNSKPNVWIYIILALVIVVIVVIFVKKVSRPNINDPETQAKILETLRSQSSGQSSISPEKQAQIMAKLRAGSTSKPSNEEQEAQIIEQLKAQQ